MLRGMRRGLTVVELMVAATLLSIILVGVVSLMVSSGREWSHGSSGLAADNRASLTLQSLEQNVRSGSIATVDSSGTVLTITNPQLTASGDYDRATTSSVSVRYYLSQGKVLRQVGTDTPTSLGSGIKSLQFAVSGQRILIRLTAQDRSGNVTRETTLESETTLRNPLVN